MSAGYQAYPYPIGPSDVLTPGEVAGTMYINGKGPYLVSDWQNLPIYDTEVLPAAIAAGTTYQFFAGLNMTVTGVRKNLLDTNMTQQSMLSKGWRAVVYGIHFNMAPGTPNDDIQLIFANGVYTFVIGNQKDEKQGLLLHAPSPYGLTGNMAIVAGAPVEKSNINNGVPSLGAVPQDVPIDLYDQTSFRVDVTFPNGIAALPAGAGLRLITTLRAYVQKPLR